MKRFLVTLGVIVLTALNAQAVTFDFETVGGGLSPLNTNVDGTSLPATSSIVAEVPGLVISSLGPSKNVDINGDGVDESFSGVSWLDFSGTGSTAHSGTNVITGANFDPADSSLRVVDFNNFVEFRVLNTGQRFFQIWLEVLTGTSVTVIFRDALNGGNDLSTQNITSSGFASFFSTTADIRNVVFIPVGGNGIWLDDLTIDTTQNGGTPIPEPSSLLLLVSGVVVLAWLRKKPSA
jgi:hypothetical protein